MFSGILHIIHIGLLAVAAVMLAHWLGSWGGLAMYIGIVVSCTFFAWLLLRVIQSEAVSWRNYLAGALLPWTSFVGGGTLQALLAKNALASTLFGLAIETCWQSNLLGNVASIGGEVAEPGSWQTMALLWLTVVGWVALFVGWLWLLKSSLSRRSEPISMIILGRNRLLFPLVLPPIVLITSIALRFFGFLWISFLTVWILLLIVLLPIILMVVVILAYTVAGKPIRWN